MRATICTPALIKPNSIRIHECKAHSLETSFSGPRGTFPMCNPHVRVSQMCAYVDLAVLSWGSHLPRLTPTISGLSAHILHVLMHFSGNILDICACTCYPTTCLQSKSPGDISAIIWIMHCSGLWSYRYKDADMIRGVGVAGCC